RTAADASAATIPYLPRPRVFPAPRRPIRFMGQLWQSLRIRAFGEGGGSAPVRRRRIGATPAGRQRGIGATPAQLRWDTGEASARRQCDANYSDVGLDAPESGEK